MPTTTTDLCWAAGFIEGEGSFHCDPRKSLLHASAVQKDRETLDRLASLFGGSVIQRALRKGESRFSIFTWVASGVRAAGVMMTLYGLMSSRRKRQIEVALSRWRGHRAHHRHWSVCKRGHPFTEENTYRHPTTGMRKCKECIRTRNRSYEWERRRAEGRAYRAKVTEDDVRSIRARAAAGMSQAALCREYGLTPGTMHHIVHGITWKSVV